MSWYFPASSLFQLNGLWRWLILRQAVTYTQNLLTCLTSLIRGRKHSPRVKPWWYDINCSQGLKICILNLAINYQAISLYFVSDWLWHLYLPGNLGKKLKIYGDYVKSGLWIAEISFAAFITKRKTGYMCVCLKVRRICCWTITALYGVCEGICVTEYEH